MTSFNVKTKGHYDFVDITSHVAGEVHDSGLRSGIAVVFLPGTTAAITTMEHEAGSQEDLKALFERWAPEDADYHHHKKWGDRNGAAHMKSAIIGADVSVPFKDGGLLLGQWQRIVLIDLDERSRTRKVIVTLIPEPNL